MISRIVPAASCLALAAALLAAPAQAQTTPPAPMHPGMPGMAMPPPVATPPPAAASPSTAAFKAADDKMMQAMDRPMSGDPDRDFVAGMLPHHQGAVDMARIQLQYGKDPQLRRLAHDIIAAQDKEIALMQAWQKRHPPK